MIEEELLENNGTDMAAVPHTRPYAVPSVCPSSHPSVLYCHTFLRFKLRDKRKTSGVLGL